MRIMLVHPTGSNWIPGKKDITATANRMAPLGLLSIAAYLGREGHDVSVYDCLGPKVPAKNQDYAKIILDNKPDLIGFSATTSGFLDGYELAGMIKSQRPQTQIVFGGGHISALRKYLLEKFEHIDFLIPGEGEITLCELASGKSPESIDGLIWRNNGNVTENKERTPIQDMDMLPFPAYEKLSGFPKGYHLPLFSYILSPGATMITSRGCPYQCSYCDRSVFKRSYRYNSAEYIYEHMAYLRKQFGVKHINIYDDLFTMHRKRIVQLCSMLTDKPLGMQFNCAVRVGHTDDELLDMLKKAGCLQVSVGIETAEPELMETHKPGVQLDEVRDTVHRIKNKGLRIKGLFMMGLPGDTESSIQKTSDFAMSLDLDDMNMSKFTPFPGAPIWQTIEKEGSFDNDWRKMNCLNFVFVPIGIESKEKLDLLYNRHVKRFYSGSAWRNKLMRRTWQHRWSLWHFVSNLPDFMAARRQFEPAE